MTKPIILPNHVLDIHKLGWGCVYLHMADMASQSAGHI